MVVETRRSLRVTPSPLEEKPTNIPHFNHNRSRSSLPLEKNSDLKTLLQSATDSCIILRGPRYDAYSKLRQSKLQMRHAIEQVSGVKQSLGISVPKSDSIPSPIKKSVRFQGNRHHQFRPTQNRSSSVVVGSSGLVAESVPDFSVLLRKENRMPAVNRVEKLGMGMGTPPPRRALKVQGSGSKLLLGRSNKTVNSGDMMGVSGGCGVMGRREMRRMSYAGVEEVRRLSSAAAVGSAKAISRENRGGRFGRTSTKWV